MEMSTETVLKLKKAKEKLESTALAQRSLECKKGLGMVVPDYQINSAAEESNQAFEEFDILIEKAISEIELSTDPQFPHDVLATIPTGHGAFEKIFPMTF